MAIIFSDPGGDATFNLANTSSGGFYSSVGLVITTDIVHGDHIKSIRMAPSNTNVLRTPNNVISDSGSRTSTYLYIKTLGSGIVKFFSWSTNNGSAEVFKLKITTGGILQLFNGSNVQIGSNGATLSTGQWYRISVAYTIASTTVNRIELFVHDSNGSSLTGISVTNATLAGTGTSTFSIGNDNSLDNLQDFRFSDIYIDDSSSLTDIARDVWITAKRPFSNGTLNEWTTQIGSGGSGYGSGHSSQVNERPVSTTNGWSFQDTILRTEEYTIEGASVGDINITGSQIIDFMGWVNAKVASNSTGNIILAGIATNINVTTSYNMFTKAAGSTIYPIGGTDIGMNTNTVNQLFSLADCGIMIAYIPGSAISGISTISGIQSITF